MTITVTKTDVVLAAMLEDSIRDWEERSLAEVSSLIDSGEARIDYEAFAKLIDHEAAWLLTYHLNDMASEAAWEAGSYLEYLLLDREAMARLKGVVKLGWGEPALSLHYCCVEPGELAAWVEGYSDYELVREYEAGTFDDCLGRVQAHRY